jgi:hypothetical protein
MEQQLDKIRELLIEAQDLLAELDHEDLEQDLQDLNSIICHVEDAYDEALEDSAYDGQPTEQEEWHSFDPDC